MRNLSEFRDYFRGYAVLNYWEVTRLRAEGSLKAVLFGALIGYGAGFFSNEFMSTNKSTFNYMVQKAIPADINKDGLTDLIYKEDIYLQTKGGKFVSLDDSLKQKYDSELDSLKKTVKRKY